MSEKPDLNALIEAIPPVTRNEDGTIVYVGISADESQSQQIDAITKALKEVSARLDALGQPAAPPPPREPLEPEPTSQTDEAEALRRQLAEVTAERDALKFRMEAEPETIPFDKLPDLEENLTTLKETLDDRTADFDLFNEDGSVNNDARNKLLDRLIRQEGELRRARKAGATDTLEKEDTVQKLQRFLGILGSRSV